MHSKYAGRMLDEHFKYAYYLGRYQVDPSEDVKPHKFYYIGHGDAFGVAMAESRGRVGYQIWGISWVRGRSAKLDRAIANALKGKFINCRHNVQVDNRANKHGTQFIKPTWVHEAAPAAKKAAKLPLRKKTGRRRRKLLI